VGAPEYRALVERIEAQAQRHRERYDEWKANGSATEATMHAAWLVSVVLRALLEPDPR
jgi:hypothetical protein